MGARRADLSNPASDWPALEAALAGGADVICFGAQTKNLRALSREVEQPEFAEAICVVHARHAKAHLVLNSDLEERELRLAARILQVAEQQSIDAVLVRDPALLALGPAFPSLVLAWDAVNAVASSADVLAAERLGVSSAVAVPETTQDERSAASASEQVELAVAAENVHCESIPGRCLWSSWSDGHSANRGACPCRSQATADTELSENRWEFIESAAAMRSGESAYQMDIQVTDRGIECCCRYLEAEMNWTLPKTVVHRAHKAVTVGQLLAFFEAKPMSGIELSQGTTNAPDFLMVPRKVNYLADQIEKFLRRCRKKQQQAADAELPEHVSSIIDGYERCPSSRTTLGQPADRVRLDMESAASFLSMVKPSGVIVEGVTADRFRELRSHCSRVPLIVALPPVFFENELDEIRKLLSECVRAKCRVEVNSWGGWYLAKQAGVRIEAGPYLPVLNSLAARLLGSLGIENVTWSMEADRRKLERLSDRCPIHASLVVFGRPPLMIARQPPADDGPGGIRGKQAEMSVLPRQENGLWVLRPFEPFDMRSVLNEHICVKHLVVDLVASPDPVKEWFAARDRQTVEPFQFNYNRRLA